MNYFALLCIGMTILGRSLIATIVFALLLTVHLSSCTDSTGDGHCIMPADVELCRGDIVFRLGGGMESHAVMMMDTHGRYSHVGIVVDTLDRLMIVHAVPGEPDFDGDVDRVKVDSIEKFFGSVYANRGEVVRCSDSAIARKASENAMAICRRGTLFDHDYNSSDTTKMYCTELVMYAYEKAGLRLTEREPHSISLPLLKAEVYYPSDIYDCKKLKSIRKF